MAKCSFCNRGGIELFDFELPPKITGKTPCDVTYVCLQCAGSVVSEYLTETKPTDGSFERSVNMVTTAFVNDFWRGDQ